MNSIERAALCTLYLYNQRKRLSPHPVEQKHEVDEESEEQSDDLDRVEFPSERALV